MRCTRTIMLSVVLLLLCGQVFAVPTDIISTLQQQVTDLIDYRNNMDKSLDELKIANHIQIATLKEEIEELRRDLSNLHSGGILSQNKQRNDQLTTQWMQNAVQELRREVQAELQAAHNASDIRAHEFSSVTNNVEVLKTDLVSARAELDAVRTEQERTLAKTQQLEQELENVRDIAQSCSASCSNLRAQVESAQSEWSSIQKKRSTPAAIIENEAYIVAPIELERRVRRIEKRMKNTMWSHARSAGRAAEHAELLERVNALEKSSRTGAKALFNVSREVAGMERVQQSTAQLLESVSALESRLDSTLPELQKEVSRLEFELAQATSSIQLAKDAQDQQETTLKSLSENVSQMEGSWSADRALIVALQNSATEAPKVDKNLEKGVSRVVRDLSRLETEYRHIMQSLPTDCQSVSGPSGEYLIHPSSAPEDDSSSDGAPVLTWCDQQTGAGGWTVIQRRSDGQEQFNRLWAEYQTGFGTPAGEFWLGNAALRRLTYDNCSSLRVDIRDIYGETWYAEYTEFSVADAGDGYRLWVSGYQGNASDAFEYQNHMQFSSIDSDRDISNTHCAANYEGGWWFSHCQHVNLNGRYNLGLTWFDASRNEWIAVARSEMKIRRRPGCPQ